MGMPEVQVVFDLLYTFREVSRVKGVRMPSGMDPQYPFQRRRRRRICLRSSRIRRPWHGAPMSFGSGTRQRPSSTPGRRLPCSNTSGRWTLTCPPPPWRTCTLLWTGNSYNLRHAWRPQRCPQVQMAQVHKGLLAVKGAGSAAPMDGDPEVHQGG